MRIPTFATHVIRTASALALVVALAACSSPTAPRFPEEEKEEQPGDPKEGMTSR